MPALVDDAILDHFVVRGTLEELPGRVSTPATAATTTGPCRTVPLEGVDLDRLGQFVAAASCSAPFRDDGARSDVTVAA